MRLTADGRFHLCLLNDDEVDVRATLRRGGDTRRRWPRSCCEPSPTSPSAIGSTLGRFTEERQMFQIGG